MVILNPHFKSEFTGLDLNFGFTFLGKRRKAKRQKLGFTRYNTQSFSLKKNRTEIVVFLIFLFPMAGSEAIGKVISALVISKQYTK